jgi:hypothetical protein
MAAMTTEPVWEAFVLHRERIGAGDISNTVLRVEVPQLLPTTTGSLPKLACE